MAVDIQLKHDTAANWTSADPTLLDGELGFESDTEKFKIGDGSTAWSFLTYFLNEDGLTLTDYLKKDGSVDLAGNWSVGTYQVGDGTGNFSFDGSGNAALTHNLTITGNLTVDGTTFESNTETVQVEDNLMVVNYGESGAGVTAGSAGLQIDRGSATDYQFLFDETDDLFKVGEIGSLQVVATREDSPVSNGIPYWDNANSRFSTSTTVDKTELEYLNNVSSNIQDQLNGKSATGHNHNLADLTEKDHSSLNDDEATKHRLINDSAGNGDTTELWSADKIFDQLVLKVATSGNESIAGIKTFSAGGKFTEKIVIPLNEPTSLENGDIWIA